jgi:hypothetical protein
MVGWSGAGGGNDGRADAIMHASECGDGRVAQAEGMMGRRVTAGAIMHASECGDGRVVGRRRRE